MTKSDLTGAIKKKAFALGFAKAGIARAGEVEKSRLEQWLQRRFHGDMQYMENHAEKRTDPRKLVKGAKSVISVAMNYYTPFQHSSQPDKGKISRYAWGDDYHDVLKGRLDLLLQEIQSLDKNINGRVFVDTAPIMDKQWAVRSGIGWQGKHSNVITRELGSWIFLGEVVVDIELDYDEPIAEYCGTCTRCLEACPTGAIVEPYIVDARKCISYLTVELKPDKKIPARLQPKLGRWIFGCDICQDVCPWNKKFAQETEEKAFQPRPANLNPDLAELAQMTQEEFRQRNKKSPLTRPKYRGFLRNVTVALRNAHNRL
jgi:epoxyqueuosine reductase